MWLRVSRKTWVPSQQGWVYFDTHVFGPWDLFGTLVISAFPTSHLPQGQNVGEWGWGQR